MSSFAAKPRPREARREQKRRGEGGGGRGAGLQSTKNKQVRMPFLIRQPEERDVLLLRIAVVTQDTLLPALHYSGRKARRFAGTFTTEERAGRQEDVELTGRRPRQSKVEPHIQVEVLVVPFAHHKYLHL